MENYQLYDMQIASSAMAKYGKARFRIKMLVIEELCAKRKDILEKLKEPSEKYKEFQGKYQKAILPYVEKNEGGMPILYTGLNGSGAISTNGKGFPKVVEDVEEFTVKKKELDDEYKHVIEEYEKSEVEWLEAMKKKVDPEIEFSKVDIDEFPDNIKDEKDGSNLYDSYLKVLMPIINS